MSRKGSGNWTARRGRKLVRHPAVPEEAARALRVLHERTGEREAAIVARLIEKEEKETRMLSIFDLDGTLISSYMDTPDRNINDWHVLPGRTEVLHRLRREGHRVAIISNQAGVAFGYTTEEEIVEKISQVLKGLYMYSSYDKRDEYGKSMDLSRHVLFGSGAESVHMFGRAMRDCYRADTAPPALQTWMTIHVCYGHEKSRDARYNGAEADRRKPSPAMLLEAMAAHGVEPERVRYVGDMDSDRQAAAAAGVAYQDVSEFFNAEAANA